MDIQGVTSRVLPVVCAKEVQGHVELKNVGTEEDKVADSQSTNDDVTGTQQGTHKETEGDDSGLGDVEERQGGLVDPIGPLVVHNGLVVALHFKRLGVVVFHLWGRR